MSMLEQAKMVWKAQAPYDHIWGYVPLNSPSVPENNDDYPDFYLFKNYLVFWGRRRGKLNWKVEVKQTGWSLYDRLIIKKDKGYVKVKPVEFPEIEKQLEELLVLAILST